MNQDDLKKKIARDVLDALDRIGTTDIETARKCLEQITKCQSVGIFGVATGQLEYRTCVRLGEKTVHMQIRGPADAVAQLPLMPHDDTDEQMCDDWTKWEEI